MSRIHFIAGLILAVSCGQALAQSDATVPACYNDKISNASGLMIRMGSGQIFQAYPGSSGKLASWLPLDKVKICYIGGSAVQITDLSNNQQIKALRK